MKITEVRIFPKEDEDKKLRAFATVTFDDCFVVRDLKIIEGNKGLFVAMPSRRTKQACPRCRHRNVVHSQYCNQCGGKLGTGQEQERPLDMDDAKLRQSEHKDIAHPITLEFREYIQKTVLDTYQSQRHQKETN
jgi:stage V sporulation protein G